MELVQVVIAKSKSFMGLSTNATESFRELARPADRRPVVASIFSDFFSAFRARNSFMCIGPMFLAKRFVNCLLSADFTKTLRVPAFPAESPLVLTHVVRHRTWLTALLATCCRSTLFSRLSVVMNRALSFSKVRPIATRHIAASWGLVNSHVLSRVIAQLKVLKAIVVSHFVFVMDYFLPRQIPPKVCLHYKPMLSNVAPSITTRMIGHFHSDVTIYILKLFSCFKVRSAFHGGMI